MKKYYRNYRRRGNTVFCAVVGGLMSVAGKIINIAQRQDEINTKQSIENVSVQMNYIRAGAGGRRT